MWKQIFHNKETDIRKAKLQKKKKKKTSNKETNIPTLSTAVNKSAKFMDKVPTPINFRSIAMGGLGYFPRKHIPGMGSLDIYKDYHWSVTKVDSEEDLKLASKKEKCSVLDLALVMDCTGSMRSWIQHCKDTLSTVIDNIKNSSAGSRDNPVVRVAFVGYRDFGDGDNIFSIHDFTSDIPAIKHFISNQQATGGGDAPEDVVGAMHQVLQLSWYPESVRLVTIIADAPTHGNSYHSEAMEDDYLEGSPAGLLLEEMTERFKNGNLDLTLYKLNDCTEVMYNIMKGVGEDWVHFVDMRPAIRASRDSGYGDSSGSVRAAFSAESSGQLSARYAERSTS